MESQELTHEQGKPPGFGGWRGSSGLGACLQGGQPFPIPHPKTRAAGTAGGEKGAKYRRIAPRDGRRNKSEFTANLGEFEES